jgi:dienelactone hydrolase
MQHEHMPYEYAGITFKGESFHDPAFTSKRPGVLVAHAWRGQDDFAIQKAKALATLGYVGMAIDLYGNGTTAASNDEAQQLMLPLFIDRKELRARITAAHAALCHHPLVNSRHTGAIGFCFGGLSVIELLKSGCDIRGAVSFHGVLGDTFVHQKATLEPNFATSNSALLLLHGADDPLVTNGDLKLLGQELTDSGVDWQFHIYGHTVHAFTNPEANESGMMFNTKANSRSWMAMCNFFKEIFQ